MKGQDVYKEVVTMEFPNMVARIHIPDLTEEEQNRRMQQIYKASVNLLLNKKKG